MFHEACESQAYPVNSSRINFCKIGTELNLKPDLSSITLGRAYCKLQAAVALPLLPLGRRY
ncbi:hypothetical protein V1477_011217 [Vespula maculifrons]